MAFEQGDIVDVRRYGEGTVTMVCGDQVAVVFPDGETRSFIARYLRRLRQASSLITTAPGSGD
jgi:ATP-dependent DNA helicase RecQ